MLPAFKEFTSHTHTLLKLKETDFLRSEGLVQILSTVAFLEGHSLRHRMKKLIGQELGLCVEGSRWLAESLESAVGHRELLWFAPLEGAGRPLRGQPLSGPRDQERI